MEPKCRGYSLSCYWKPTPQVAVCTQRSALLIRGFSFNMHLYNICTKKEYEANGEKRAKWYRVGVLKINAIGKMYIKLFQQPDTEFFVFDFEDKRTEDQN